MILSRILMVLALAVLAYLVYITMNGSEHFKANPNLMNKMNNRRNIPQLGKQENFGSNVVQIIQPESFTNNVAKKENMGCSVNPQPQIPQMEQIESKSQSHSQSQSHENFVAAPQQIVYEPVKQDMIPQNISYDEAPKAEPLNNNQSIKYEAFADIGGIADSIHGAAPFGGKAVMDEGDMAKVNYSGLVDANPGDVIQIEGTDLLTAPLVDNMLYTNSIANTNRNASQDLRGDIPLQFNDTYTPFYSSVIYGAPLSEKQMTIGKI